LYHIVEQVIYLTPLIPLSFKGEGEGLGRGALAPLKHPDKWGYNVRVSSKGIKRGEALIGRCSYHNSLPSPLHKGIGKKGEGLINSLKGLPLTISR